MAGHGVFGAGSAAGSGEVRRPGPPVIDVYARLSVAPDGETIQVDDQAEWCADAVVERGGVVGRIFKDNSKSAWKPGVVRPDWEALMRRLESGASDGVIVWDLSRFSRKILEGERLIDLAGRGVRVWSQSGSYELSTADGRRHFRDDMVTAAAESDKISERVRRGKLRRARRGRGPGGMAGYGMPRLAPKLPGWLPGDAREPLPDAVIAAERAIIRECYRRILGGESLIAVAADLTARGVPTRSGGARWTTAHLGRTLCRPILAGLIQHGGTILTEASDGDAVVSREEWERMCALAASRRRGRPAGQGPHLLSGLLRCGRCGQWMQGRPRPGMFPYPDGSVAREYRCRWEAGTGRGCAGIGIDARAVEAAVGEATQRRLGDPARAERIAAHLTSVREERAAVATELAALNASADALAGKVATWGVARVDAAMEPLLARVAVLHATLAGLEQPETTVTAAESAAQAWRDAHAAGDRAALRAMVRTAFPRLTVRPKTRRGDHGPARLDWDGTTLPAGPDPATLPSATPDAEPAAA